MTAKPAPVFLDRDGTLIVEKGYLRDPDEVRLEEGVVEGLTLLRDGGHPLIVLSNQSGIGRGMFTEHEARLVNARAADLMLQHGIEVTAWYVCPHEPAALCHCRKPLAGMAVAASRDCSVELDGSYVIGDKRSDVEMADAIGAMGILVTTGHGGAWVEWAKAAGRPVFAGLQGAASYIVDHASMRLDPETVKT